MNGAGRFGAGMLIGLLASAGLGLMIRSDGNVVTTTTTVTTAAPETRTEPWFELEEVMIGATALLPRDLNVEDGMAFFDYDLAGLGPTLSADGQEERPDLATPHGDYLAMPERWVLTTASGQTVEASSGPFDSSVRFELPTGQEEVASIALVGWRIAVPFGERIELPIEEGVSGSTRRGTATIETVLEQSISTIVQIDFDSDGDSWDTNVALLPLDSHWRVSGRQFGGLQLIWEGTDAPDSVVLEDAGFTMRSISGELLVVAEADDQ